MRPKAPNVIIQALIVVDPTSIKIQDQRYLVFFVFHGRAQQQDYKDRNTH